MDTFDMGISKVLEMLDRKIKEEREGYRKDEKMGIELATLWDVRVEVARIKK